MIFRTKLDGFICPKCGGGCFSSDTENGEITWRYCVGDDLTGEGCGFKWRYEDDWMYLVVIQLGSFESKEEYMQYETQRRVELAARQMAKKTDTVPFDA